MIFDAEFTAIFVYIWIINQHNYQSAFDAFHTIMYLSQQVNIWHSEVKSMAERIGVFSGVTRLVSPGAVTDGVALFTSKSDDLFLSSSYRRHSHPLRLSR